MGGTQTRRDLADLEEVYQNFANFNKTDSGLNTMMRTTIQEYGRLMSDEDSGGGGLDQSGFGLEAVRAIKDELEKKALADVLAQIENQVKMKETWTVEKRNEPTKSGGGGAWPPKQYRHIRGSGYGTTWGSSAGRAGGKGVERSGDGSRERTSSGSPGRKRQESGYTKEEIDTQNYIIRLKSMYRFDEGRY